MSDWQEGDRFELKAKGVVQDVGANWIQVRTGSPMGSITFGLDWFDGHATKVQKPFEFGDKVWFRADDGADFHKAVVLRGEPATMIWIQGAVGPRDARNDKLTLIDSGGNADE